MPRQIGLLLFAIAIGCGNMSAGSGSGGNGGNGGSGGNGGNGGTGGNGGGGTGGNGGGSGGTGGGGAAEPDYVSGSRIKARTISTSDGAKAFAGYYDTQLATPCSFNHAADDTLRCLPPLVAYVRLVLLRLRLRDAARLRHRLRPDLRVQGRDRRHLRRHRLQPRQHALSHVFDRRRLLRHRLGGHARLVQHDDAGVSGLRRRQRSRSVVVRGRVRRQRALKTLPWSSCRSWATTTRNIFAKASPTCAPTSASPSSRASARASFSSVPSRATTSPARMLRPRSSKSSTRSPPPRRASRSRTSTLPPTPIARARLPAREVPAIVFGGTKSKGTLRYFGLPAGYEMSTLVSTLMDLGSGEAMVPPEVADELGKLSSPVHIQVFVTPG